MNANRIYTRKLLGLDNRVWIFMIAIIILAIGLLSYTLADRKECVTFTFNIKAITNHAGNIFYTDETLSFSASEKTQNIQWDFGDNTSSQTGQNVTHRFTKEGKYFITATIFKGCETIKEITVKAPLAAPIIIDSTNVDIGEKIIGHLTTFSGTNEVYVCAAIGNTYDWVIVNRPAIKPESLGSTANFKFPNAGKYTIQVTVDNDRNKRYFKDIVVQDVAAPTSTAPEKITRLIPLPQAPPIQNQPQENQNPAPPEKQQQAPATQAPVVNPPPSGKKVVGNAGFKEYLEKVMDNEMTVADFDKYLCGGGSTKVILNGDKRDVQTFASLCNFLSQGKVKKMVIFKKKIKLVSVVQHRDNTGCVTLLDVNYD
ncbi:MAG: PKD domain-containing protein [Ginsengibacter sp.]